MEVANRSKRGQSLIEMALMMVLFLIILAGVLDLGRLYFTFLALHNAAGEGAAYGAMHPNWHCGEESSCPLAHNADPNNITFRVQHESPSGLIDWSNTTVTISAVDPTPGNQIAVTAAYEYTLLTPFLGALVGGQTLPVDATATAVILSD